MSHVPCKYIVIIDITSMENVYLLLLPGDLLYRYTVTYKIELFIFSHVNYHIININYYTYYIDTLLSAITTSLRCILLNKNV